MSIFKRKDPSELQQQLKSFENKGAFESDAAVWQLSQDPQGNGSAVIRFLPAAADDATTFVKLTNHGFQRNGKWYIENCHSTHGDWETCPACQWLKDQNWDYKNEADKKAMYNSGVTRKTSFWANILVITDPSNPDNDGKVFKMRFGKKLMDKILAEVNVDTSLGEVPCDVTCPFEGKNMILKVKKVGGNNNYDDSKFQAVSAIKNIDDESYQQKLFEQMHDIMSIVSKDKFKSKEELTTNFNRVMGGAARAATSSRAESDFDAQMKEFETKDSTQASAPARSAMSSVTSTEDNLDADLDALLNEI